MNFSILYIPKAMAGYFKHKSSKTILLICIAALFSYSAVAQIPHLKKKGTTTQLMVDNKPFIMLAGELHNSSASSEAYMKPIWPRLKALNLNTVLANISWELVEPQEGKFDFSSVDRIIENARAHDMKLVLLWFGSWKNGKSTYAPAWVKQDLERFPRVKDATGNSMEILSPFGKNTLEADKKAFVAFMKHIKKADSKEQTVVMVQIENEVGVLGETRDFSELANEAVKTDVPPALSAYLKEKQGQLTKEIVSALAEGKGTQGTWSEVFGAGFKRDEIFMAYHYGKYMNELAVAGKAVYPLPMFINAWGKQNDEQVPGGYPSGGPISAMMNVYHVVATDIDFLSPDIYSKNFKEEAAKYNMLDNPLFIPETRPDAGGAERPFVALAELDAMGIAVFAIDEEQFDEDHPISNSYGLLQDLSPLISQNQGTETMRGFLQLDNSSETLEMANFNVNIIYQGSKSDESKGCGLIIETGENEFIVAGRGFNMIFEPKDAEQNNLGILSIDESKYENGNWVPLRRMNGDESGSGTMVRLPKKASQEFGVQKVRLYTYPVTRIAGYKAEQFTANDRPGFEGSWNTQVENSPQGDGKGIMKFTISGDTYQGSFTSNGYEIDFEKVEVTDKGLMASFTQQGFNIAMNLELKDPEHIVGNVSDMYPLTGTKIAGENTVVDPDLKKFIGNWEMQIQNTPEGNLTSLLSIMGKGGSLTINGEATPLKKVSAKDGQLTISVPFQGYDASIELQAVDDNTLKGNLSDLYDLQASRK